MICLDVFQIGVTHAVKAHAVDGMADVHRDPSPLVLSGGGISLVKAYFVRIRDCCMGRNKSDGAEMQVVLWCHDNPGRAPFIMRSTD